MTARLNLVFCLVLVAIFAAGLVSALGFRRQAQLFPLWIAAVGLGLALLQTGIEIRRLAASRPIADEVSAEPAEAAPPTFIRVQRTLATLGWIVGFAVGVLLIGFPLAVTLGTAAYLRFVGKESIPLSAAFGAGSGAVFYLVFIRAVRIPFDDGLIQYWLGLA